MTEQQTLTGSEPEDRDEDDRGELQGAVTSERRHVPASIKDDPIWAIWDMDDKVPLAPWKEGHCYRTKWAGDMPADQRPEVTYEKAQRFASVGPHELNRNYPFPDGVPDTVKPTILLPPDPRELGYRPALMYVDLDDVRDPDTGEITDEAREIVERLDSYTEISSSGTGLHILVWADLPDTHLDVNKPLNDIGGIELYDHSRFFGGTWKHVEGAAKPINERQAVVDELVETYDPRDEPEAGAQEFSPSDNQKATDVFNLPELNEHSGNSGESSYYDVGIEKFALPDGTVRTPGDEKQGPHPHHGKTTSGEESTNYIVDTTDDVWHCFAHSSGGKSMHMAAIMAGEMDCDDSGQGALDGLSDEEFLRTCLYARDNLNGFTDEMKPPYRALVAIARLFDLSMRDEKKEILGSTTYESARAIYDQVDKDDI